MHVMAKYILTWLSTGEPLPEIWLSSVKIWLPSKKNTVKPLYLEAHLIRIPVLFEFIVHFSMGLNS